MFNSNLEGTFKLFGLQHLLAILVSACVVGLVVLFKHQLRKPWLYDKVRIGLAVFIILQEISVHLFRYFSGTWSLKTSLPAHLCSFAIFSTAYILVKENKQYFLSTFFVMMIGATLAIATPDVEYGFPHFRFIQFFISHGFLIVNFVFILLVMDYQKDMRYRYLLNNLVALFIFAILSFCVNVIVDGNYMFLMRKPDQETALDLFGEHPWYLLNILWLAVPLLFHLFYMPFFIKSFYLRKDAFTLAE